MVTKKFFDKLTSRQQLFCQYVAEGNNPSQAAIQAGYSEKGNRSRASRLMKRAEIQAEILKLQQVMASQRISTVQERKIRLSEVIEAKITDYFEEINGEIKLKANVDKAKAYSLFKVKSKKKTDKSGKTIITTSIKFPDKLKAIRELNKIEGVYPKQPRRRKAKRR